MAQWTATRAAEETQEQAAKAVREMFAVRTLALPMQAAPTQQSACWHAGLIADVHLEWAASVGPMAEHKQLKPGLQRSALMRSAKMGARYPPELTEEDTAKRAMGKRGLFKMVVAIVYWNMKPLENAAKPQDRLKHAFGPRYSLSCIRSCPWLLVSTGYAMSCAILVPRTRSKPIAFQAVSFQRTC